MHDFCGRDAIGGAADFAAFRVKSGVKGRVTGEGGATPLISRGLDPRLTARAGRPEGRSPLVVTEQHNRALAILLMRFCCCRHSGQHAPHISLTTMRADPSL